MDLNPNFWIAAVALFFSIVSFIYVRFGDSRKEMVKDLNGFGQRLAKLETSVEKGPNLTHIGELHEKMNSAINLLARVEGAMEQAQRTREEEQRSRDKEHELIMAIYKKIILDNKQ